MDFLRKISKARKLPNFFLKVMEALECTSSISIAAITDERLAEFSRRFEDEIKYISGKIDHPDHAEVKAHVLKTTKTDNAENYKISFGVVMIIKGIFKTKTITLKL